MQYRNIRQFQRQVQPMLTILFNIQEQQVVVIPMVIFIKTVLQQHHHRQQHLKLLVVH